MEWLGLDPGDVEVLYLTQSATLEPLLIYETFEKDWIISFESYLVLVQTSDYINWRHL